MVEARGGAAERQVGLPFSVRFAHRVGSLFKWDAPKNWAQKHAEEYFKENHPQVEKQLNEATKIHDKLLEASRRAAELESEFGRERSVFSGIRFNPRASTQEVETIAEKLSDKHQEWLAAYQKMLELRNRAAAFGNALPTLQEMTFSLSAAAPLTGSSQRITQAQKHVERIQALLEKAAAPLEIDEETNLNLQKGARDVNAARLLAEEKHTAFMEEQKKQAEKEKAEETEPEKGGRTLTYRPRSSSSYEPAPTSYLPLFTATNDIEATSHAAMSTLVTGLSRQGRAINATELSALQAALDKAAKAHGKVQRSRAQDSLVRRYKQRATESAARLQTAVNQINAKLKMPAGRKLEFAY